MKNLCKIIFLSLIFYINSEAQQITWQRLYNGPSNFSDLGYSVCELRDGNFIIAGATQTPFYAIYILKLNCYGDTLWTRTIGGFSPGQLAYAITASNDGGFVFTGDADTAFVIKMNNLGEIVWYKKYNKFRYVQCYDIKNTFDGGYIACGRILHEGGFILKIDSNGILQWVKNISGEFTSFNRVINAHNSGYILSGSIYDTPTGDTIQSIVIRINDFGNIIWQRRYTILDGTNGKSIGLLNSGYILSGTATKNLITDPIAEIYFIRLDTNGNIKYSKIFNSGVIETLRNQIIINENKYLFVISTDSINITNAKLILTDSLGYIQKQMIYPSIKYLYLESAIVSSNNKYIFTGTWGKYGNGDRDDIYVLKTDSNLKAPPLLSISSIKLKSYDDYKLYPSFPNPFNPNTAIKFELKKKSKY